MIKTIKVIDLLNKIANGESLPLEILILDEVYYLLKDDKGNVIYSQSKEPNNWEAYIDCRLNLTRCLKEKVTILDDTVEIIEEQQDIDIQGIENAAGITFNFPKDAYTAKQISDNFETMVKLLNMQSDKQNELIRAVKQLDKQINLQSSKETKKNK